MTHCAATLQLYDSSGWFFVSTHLATHGIIDQDLSIWRKYMLMRNQQSHNYVREGLKTLTD